MRSSNRSDTTCVGAEPFLREPSWLPEKLPKLEGEVILKSDQVHRAESPSRQGPHDHRGSRKCSGPTARHKSRTTCDTWMSLAACLGHNQNVSPAGINTRYHTGLGRSRSGWAFRSLRDLKTPLENVNWMVKPRVGQRNVHHRKL